MAKNTLLAAPSIWMINNPIASSLLTCALIIFGYLSFTNIVQETSPSFKVDEIIIEASYPGASPKDIERSIIVNIENKLRDNVNIEQITATASEGLAEVSLELVDVVDANTVLQQVKNSIDGIDSFPIEMEQPTIEIAQRVDSIVEIGVHGNVSEQMLYQQASQLKQAMLTELDIAKVEINGARSPEIIIEADLLKLQQYHLTIAQVLAKVKESVFDIPAGKIETSSGAIIVRTHGRKELITEFAAIEIITDNFGGRVTLADIATISHGFQGVNEPFFVNGDPGLELVIYQNVATKPVEISQNIQSFINDYRQTIPAQIRLTILQDQATPFIERITMLTSNGAIGMLLVIIVLSLFLDFRLAFWVSMGIPIAIIGAMGSMPLLNIPINMITLFAFILTLGILVDDAVIVAENIYQKVQTGIEMSTALKEGTKEMALPVVFSVATNIIAFIPLLFVPGTLGVMYQPMTMLIFAIFIVSLIEALLILPLHLRKLDKPLPNNIVVRLQTRCFSAFERFKNQLYGKWLKASLATPIVVIVLFVSLTCVVFSWVYSGRVDSSFAPKIESTRIDAEVEFPVGSPLHDKLSILKYITKAGDQALAQLNGSSGKTFHMQDVTASSGSSTFMLVAEQNRSFTATEFVNQWRKNIGEVPGVKSVFFDYQVGPGGGKELVIELGHHNANTLSQAVTELMDELCKVTGIADIDSELLAGNQQYNLIPKPLAYQLGYTDTTFGEQVRKLFFGGEAIRQIVAGDEVKVRVMMNREQQYFAEQLQSLLLTAPNGDLVTLAQVATIVTNEAATTINRVDGVQLIEVTASILRDQSNASVVITMVEDKILEKLAEKYPDLDIDLGGEARIESRVNSSIVQGIALAFGLIFALLAIIFRSYIDALLVLIIIPFCLAAAFLGHILMGFPFSVMSLFGMIALSGLVINGTFVLMWQTKTNLKRGQDYPTAIFNASLNRFRPVVLTAITTAAGLIPMLFETSTQALYLVPMAISLSFGSVFSLATILLLSPALFTLAARFRA